MVELYTKIYGEHTNISYDGDPEWDGWTTVVEVNDDEYSTHISYYFDRNSRYPMLEFEGTELDPFDLTGENWIFGKSIEEFIKPVSREYYEKTSNEYFVNYKLYPRFSYIGNYPSSNLFEVYADIDTSKITLIRYETRFDKNNIEEMINKVEHIKEVCDKNYGKITDTTYVSLLIGDFGVKDVSYEEVLGLLNQGEPGLYNIGWENGPVLDISIDAYSQYIDMGIAFSGKN